MAPSSPVVALLSIKPTYANAILDGRKKVEFRRRPFKRAVSHVVIYATSPIQRIVGWFSTKRFDQMSPAALWQRFAAIGGISKQDFNAYYAGSESGVAIHVEKARRLTKPLPISRINSGTPPQSYEYLSPTVLEHLADSAKPAPPKRLVGRRKSKAVPAKHAASKATARQTGRRR